MRWSGLAEPLNNKRLPACYFALYPTVRVSISGSHAGPGLYTVLLMETVNKLKDENRPGEHSPLYCVLEWSMVNALHKRSF